MNVSKELLSEVLDKEVTNIKMHHINDEYIYFDYIGKQSRLVNAVSINIHKVAHECKEWIKSTSHYELVIYDSNVYLTTCGLGGEGGFYYDYKFIADTEPEVVFKATSYIMEQLKQKD